MEAATSSTPNSEFPFLALPAEIRILIYKYLLGKRTIHVIFRENIDAYPTGLFGYQEPAPSCDMEGWLHARFISYPMNLERYNAAQRQWRFEDRRIPLDIFKVSRAVHAEAAAVFYRTNNFVMHEPPVLRAFARDFPGYTSLMRRMTVRLHGDQIWDPRWYSRDLFESVLQRITGPDRTTSVCIAIELEVTHIRRLASWPSKLKRAIEGLLIVRRCCSKGNFSVTFRTTQRMYGRKVDDEDEKDLDFIRDTWEKALAEASADEQNNENRCET